MTITLRIPSSFRDIVVNDLRRRHEFASERVGFVCCKHSVVPSGHLLLAYKYLSIAEEQYTEDHTVGARFDSSAIREAMQVALAEGASVLHVHLHDHSGVPRMSGTDVHEMQVLMPCFVNLCPTHIHGAMILSTDGACAKVWGTSLSSKGIPVSKIALVGPFIRFLGVI